MDRRPIRQLPPGLVNRIAAGEVIERPASVVKELIENSVDAGATQIEIEIEDGGRDLIRVVDNGNGIPADELPLALAAHATSKILTDEDLFDIHTKGFRGEALASIGSVSHLRILSRTPSSVAAYEIECREGRVSDVQAAAGNVGTRIEVRNLFVNVPARRKFLKGAGTETGHIGDAVLHIALAHPDVGFRLSSGSRVMLDLPAHRFADRLPHAWPESFIGRHLDIDETSGEWRLHGLIGLPELALPTTRHQHLFVNRRHIRDKQINHALREAFRGLVEPGRHPAAILLLDVPPDAVDVNVHPTKSEVRFRDGARVHGMVMAAVRSKLLGADLTPIAFTRSEIVMPEQQRDSLRTQLADFFRTPQHSQDAMEYSSSSNAIPSTPVPVAETSAFNTSAAAPFGTTAVFATEPSPSLAQALPSLGAIQLHNSYLIAEDEHGMVIIDQHALHERILFEELLTRLSRGQLESQSLLLPLTFAAPPQQVEMLESLAPVLEKIGIAAHAMGPDTVAVQSFPSFLSRLDPVDFVASALAKAEQDDEQLSPEALLHNLLDMMSCKAAVKAGDPLSPAEITALLSRRDLASRASNCPHGRPTTLRLSLRDLEKQFKRTGF